MMPKSMLFILLSSFLGLSFSFINIAFADAYPPIKNAKIILCDPSRAWYHIKDDPAYMLVEGCDEDTDCAQVKGDFIDYLHTKWSSDDCCLKYSTGGLNIWTPQAPNGVGVVVTAIIDDYVTDGDGNPIGYGDDNPVTVTSPKLYSFRVGCDLWWGHSQLGSDTIPFWEDEISPSKSISHPLIFNLKADLDGVDIVSHRSYKSRYTLKTDPELADLGKKNLHCVINTNMAGNIEGQVADLDPDDGDSSIDVSFAVGEGAQIGVGTTITWGSDESEGVSAAGIEFASEAFPLGGDQTRTSFELASSAFPELALPGRSQITAVGGGSVDVSNRGSWNSMWDVEGRAACISKGYMNWATGWCISTLAGTWSMSKPYIK